MAKTYTAAGSATAGQVYTASAHNVIVTDVNNLIVPPSCQVARTTDLTSYSSGAAISWTTTPTWDTDGMFSSGTPTRVTIQTAGIYLITFYAYVTGTATMTQIDPRIKIDGTSIAESLAVIQGGNLAVHTITVVSSLNAAQYVEFDVSITGGSAYVINGGAADSFERSKASVTWIGRTA